MRTSSKKIAKATRKAMREMQRTDQAVVDAAMVGVMSDPLRKRIKLAWRIVDTSPRLSVLWYRLKTRVLTR